jgi:hypothetical protein
MSFTRPWTEEEGQTATQMRQNGHTLDEIAQRIGRTGSAARWFLHKRRVEASLRSRCGLGWSENQLDACITLWREGRTASYIEARIGKSRNAVIGKMGRMFIKQGTPPSQPVFAGAEVYGPPMPPEPPPPPKPVIVRDASWPSWRCECGGTRQPGRDRCATCITRDARPNSRASMFVGYGREVA